MKPVFKLAIISTLGFVGGAATLLLAFKLSPSFRQWLGKSQEAHANKTSVYDDIIERQKGIQSQFDSLLDEDFFSQNDPFEEMRQMRKQMEKRMEELDNDNLSQANPFDPWFANKFGGGSVNDISKREDDSFVYFELVVENIKETSINAKVGNGYVTITGTIEKQNKLAENESVAQSVFKSTFSRTLPLPDNIDQNKMIMTTESDKVVLKFPKLKI